jgi:hypothetical protein
MCHVLFNSCGFLLSTWQLFMISMSYFDFCHLFYFFFWALSFCFRSYSLNLVCVCVLNMGLFKYFVSTWIIKYIFPFVVFLLWLNFVKDLTF